MSGNSRKRAFTEDPPQDEKTEGHPDAPESTERKDDAKEGSERPKVNINDYKVSSMSRLFQNPFSGLASEEPQDTPEASDREDDNKEGAERHEEDAEASKVSSISKLINETFNEVEGEGQQNTPKPSAHEAGGNEGKERPKFDIKSYRTRLVDRLFNDRPFDAPFSRQQDVAEPSEKRPNMGSGTFKATAGSRMFADPCGELFKTPPSRATSKPTPTLAKPIREALQSDSRSILNAIREQNAFLAAKQEKRREAERLKDPKEPVKQGQGKGPAGEGPSGTRTAPADPSAMRRELQKKAALEVEKKKRSIYETIVASDCSKCAKLARLGLLRKQKPGIDETEIPVLCPTHETQAEAIIREAEMATHEQRFLQVVAEKFNTSYYGISQFVSVDEKTGTNICREGPRTRGGTVMPPIVARWKDERTGYSTYAMMPIKKGEMFWYDQAYALAERYDEQARLMDWEDELERIVSKMNEDARKILMILPPYKPQTEQEQKMGKLSRIWKRWCIGCEAGRPGTCVKVFSHRLAFLNHCCVPNVQQRLAPGLVTVQTQAGDAKKGEDEGSNAPGAKGKQSGQAKGTTSTKTVTKKTALCLFLRATKDIEVGEELTINYLTMLLPSETRKTMLHCVFGFHCKCNMCTSEYSGTTDIAWTSIATAMGAGNSLTRRKRPVDCIRLLSDSMWTLMTLGVTDVRYPRMLEGAADLYTEHADLARAFYLYLITTRLFEELLGADSDDVKRVKEKTYNLTHLRPRSKRGRSTLQESMLIFMNKDREQELLFQHSIKEDKDKKYRRLKLIRKRNDWLRYFDWDKYRHERTIMELDMLLSWTEKWMEDRLKFLWEKGSLDAYEEEEAKTKGKKKTKKAKKKKKRKR